MKRSLIGGMILGFVVALFVIPLMFKIAAEDMLFKQVKSPYDFEKTVKVLVKRINNQPGWHVVNVIDQQKEILKYVGIDVGPVKIIKFCNAKYAAEMLKDDRTKFMAVKMPLSIAVYEDSKGRVYISLMNGYLLTRLLSLTPEAKIMEKVVRDIQSILSFLHFRYTIF